MAKIQLKAKITENPEDVRMPKGTYLFTVDTFEDGLTKNKDKQFLRAVAKCAEEGEYFGHPVKLGFSIEDAPGMRNFVGFCKALKLPIDVEEVETQDIIGKQLYIDVIIKKRPWKTQDGSEIELTSNEAADRDAFSPADEAPPVKASTSAAAPAAAAPTETDSWD
jgi:hypothetical protein